MTSALTAADTEHEALRAALRGETSLRHLPDAVERDFRRHYEVRANELLRRYILPLLALKALAIIPVFLFREDPSLLPWLAFGGAPIATSLLLLAVASRLPDLEEFLPLLTGAALFTCLACALFCAMYLDGQYFGQFSKFLVIYVVIASFTVLQLPVRRATPVALSALLVALVATWAAGMLPFWLDVCYYAVVPLLICSVTGYTLESSERRNFVQRRLLEQESRQLARLHAEADHNMRQQRFQADFLALIGGNHSLKELFSRTQRFLVEHTGAQVAASYHLNHRGLLRRVATWALDDAALQVEKKEFAPEDTLMGPALARGEPLHLRAVPAGYLKVDLGMGSLPSAAVLVLPIVLAGKPLAVIELGKVVPFTEAEIARAEAVRTHLAYAVSTANAREIALRAATA